MKRWIMGLGVLSLMVTISWGAGAAPEKTKAEKAVGQASETVGQASEAAVEKAAATERKIDTAKTKLVYDAKCKSCHGAKGEGNPAMAKVFKIDAAALSLNAESLKDKADADLEAITLSGKGKMPAYKDKLTEDQIKDLIAYARALGK